MKKINKIFAIVSLVASVNFGLAGKAKSEEVLPKVSTSGRDIPGLKENIHSLTAAALKNYGINVVTAQDPQTLNKIAELTNSGALGSLGKGVVYALAAPGIVMLAPLLIVNHVATRNSRNVSIVYSAYVKFADGNNSNAVGLARISCAGTYNLDNKELLVGPCRTNDDFNRGLSDGRYLTWPQGTFLDERAPYPEYREPSRGLRYLRLRHNPTGNSYTVVKRTLSL